LKVKASEESSNDDPEASDDMGEGIKLCYELEGLSLSLAFERDFVVKLTNIQVKMHMMICCERYKSTAIFCR